MKKTYLFNKNILLILFSFVVAALFMNIIQVNELNYKGSESIQNDKNLDNCEYFSIDFNSNFNGIRHKNFDKLNYVFSISENENSFKKLGLETINKFVPFDFSDSSLKLFQENNTKFLKSILPTIQTSKALRSEILLI